MARHYACGLGAQARVAQTDGAKALSESSLHLLLREITLGTYQHQHITPTHNQVFEQAFILFVAMGDKLIGIGVAIGGILTHKCLIISERVQRREIRCERLLGSRKDDFLHFFFLVHIYNITFLLIHYSKSHK